MEIKGEGRGKQLAVIPDAWLLFERMRGGVHDAWFPVLLEIDRGTQDQVKCRARLEARIEFIRSGAYKRLFGQEAVTIAYVTTGERGEYRETRRRVMCEWTKDILVKARREKWAPLFRFTSVCLEDIYESDVVEREGWYRPDQEGQVGLFTP